MNSYKLIKNNINSRLLLKLSQIGYALNCDILFTNRNPEIEQNINLVKNLKYGDNIFISVLPGELTINLNKLVNILKENKIKVNESFNLPISSMLKVANQNLNDELKNISESDMKEIESLSSMSKEELKENISKIQESIIPKLKSTLNESSDSSVKSKIEETIQKIKSSPIDKYNLYKLTKLYQGL